MTADSDESPTERLARWTAADAAIGFKAEAEQLRAQAAERVAEVDDLKARLAFLVNRVGQLEADNVELRRSASRVPLGALARRACRGVYRRARSVAGRVLRRLRR